MNLPATTTSLNIAHRTLTDIINELAAQADRLATEGDLHSLADGFAQLVKARRAFSDLTRHVETLVADTMTQDVMNLDDQVTLERRRGRDRRNYQSLEILSVLRQRSSVDENGEVRDPTGTLEEFDAALRRCVPFTGSLSWRAGALREHGIEPDEYAEVSPGRVSVKVEVAE